MSVGSRGARVATRLLPEAPGDGREVAYAQLVEPHRAELHAHCRRMLGSAHDADDALQEALVRAWRGLPRLKGPGSVRGWLYRIATNTSLDAISRRRRQPLPMGHRSAADPPGDPGGAPIEDDGPSPAARYEERESIELAFAAALELLPPYQAAVLVMRDVLGFSARDTAAALEVTVASVNSALQRGRATLETASSHGLEREGLRALGDERLRKQVGRYVNAWERDDFEAVVRMLAEAAPRMREAEDLNDPVGNHRRETHMQITKSSVETAPGPSDWFTGAVYIDAIAAPTEQSRLTASSVHFTPGARTAWHRHPNGQTIYVMEGVGLAQSRGGPIEVIRPGDRVFFEPGEDHWHGAAPDRFMTHLAMLEVDDEGNNAIWGDHVTDEEYGGAPTS